MNRSRDVVLFIGGMVFQQLVSFGSSVLVARWLGPGDYGLLSLSRNVFTVLMILAPLGLDLALLRHIPQHADEPAAMARQVTGFRFLVGGVTLLLFLLVYWVLGPLLEERFYHYQGFGEVLALTFLAAPVAADVAILGAVFRARRRPALQVMVSLYLQPAVRLSLIASFLIVGFGLKGVLIATALGYLVASLAMSVLLARWNRQEGLALDRPRRSDLTAMRLLLNDSFWLALNLLVYGMLRNMDVIVLGAWRPAQEVGEYAAMSLVAQVILFFPQSLAQTLGADVARQYAEGKIDAMIKLLSLNLRQSSLITAPIFAGIAVFSPMLDVVFGPKFNFQSDVALVLAAGYYVAAILAPMSYSLSMTGGHRLELLLLVTGTLITVAISGPITQHFGAIGIAGVIAAAYIGINSARAIMVRRIHGFFVGSWRDLLPPLVALAAALAVREAGSLFAGHSFATLVGMSTAYGILCAALFWTLLLDASERAFITSRLLRRRFA